MQHLSDASDSHIERALLIIVNARQACRKAALEMEINALMTKKTAMVQRKMALPSALTTWPQGIPRFSASVS